MTKFWELWVQNNIGLPNGDPIQNSKDSTYAIIIQQIISRDLLVVSYCLVAEVLA